MIKNILEDVLEAGDSKVVFCFVLFFYNGHIRSILDLDRQEAKIRRLSSGLYINKDMFLQSFISEIHNCICEHWNLNFI